MKKTGYPLLMIICAGLCACSSPQRTAPITDRSVITSSSIEAPIDRNVVHYTIKSGDTLSQISRRSGHSVAELASWNHLEDLNDLKVGQVLRVKPSDDGQSSAVQTASVGTASHVEVRSIDTARKETQATSATPKSTRKTETVSSSAVPASASDIKEVDGIGWSWPAQGKVIAAFAAGKNRGIDIAGTRGQKVLSAADGTVLHKGSMNGYGNLVIIKHSDNVLSAYAHNDKILVKEKQQIRRGQQIAEMGSTDSDRVKLHFEIRYQGKPVDPVKYLPAQ
ncbi:peptidoglycan DD-metalloendopeptidase family protein [Oxalobacter aliiformigenes]|uniref:Peptidoglycan DD-metalloendopeptidase family protein n=1 Tax=Oxalobacter aliiformigenes TaxID=2946593 RepID=A0ABY7JJ85_9BURK|nr:peptidoglycan DD-metalloendopeptidase family protein [Oxalobacter aliiformigenes]WAV93132.1 peptidoglycan DD-metalloendopeptidase family protein [Oxalobacter aliiformigenes]WAV95363.1 peptidoglycan DD-metalloendopeptidase family protein [Oxalobacter aliiformigenes]WAV96838.1 peptidoglycan DD-metalloendopeptidase family protein [Oxalobacter aliiformigenes]